MNTIKQRINSQYLPLKKRPMAIAIASNIVSENVREVDWAADGVSRAIRDGPAINVISVTITKITMNGIQLKAGPKTQNTAHTIKTGINKHPGIVMVDSPHKRVAIDVTSDCIVFCLVSK
jgi:hypothetical protein